MRRRTTVHELKACLADYATSQDVDRTYTGAFPPGTVTETKPDTVLLQLSTDLTVTQQVITYRTAEIARSRQVADGVIFRYVEEDAPEPVTQRTCMKRPYSGIPMSLIVARSWPFFTQLKISTTC